MTDSSLAPPTQPEPPLFLVEALAAAQATFTPVNKSRTATVPTKAGGSYSYNYADISDVLAMVRPALAAQGIAVVQPIEETPDGTFLVTRLLYRGDDPIESRIALPINGAGPQQVGSLLTYLRRYALCALVGVAAEDDDDGAGAQQTVTHTARGASQENRTGNPATAKQITLAERLLGDVVAPSMTLQYIGEACGREAPLEELFTFEASKLIDALQDDKKAGRKVEAHTEYAEDEEPF